MMRNKLYLLLAILLVFVICSVSTDQKPRKGKFVIIHKFLQKKKFVCVDSSASNDQKSRKGKVLIINEFVQKKFFYVDSSALDAKKKVNVQDKDRDEHEDEDDTIDDNYTPRGSYAHNRFSGFNPPEGNYRTRSRWSGSSPSALPAPVVTLPSSYEEFMDENDWSPFGYGK